MESPVQRGTQLAKSESCEEQEDLEEMLARRPKVRPIVKSSAVVSFHSNNKKLQMQFHSKEALKEMKSAQYEIHDVIRSSQRRMLLSRACAVLAMFGLVLTFGTSEVCRYGYLPTEEEMLEGMQDPYALTGPCDGSNAFKLWLLQASISFSTALLGLAVVMRNLVTLQEREQQVMFIARNADPPDLTTFHRRMRRARRQAMWRNTAGMVCQMLKRGGGQGSDHWQDTRVVDGDAKIGILPRESCFDALVLGATGRTKSSRYVMCVFVKAGRLSSRQNGQPQKWSGGDGRRQRQRFAYRHLSTCM